MLSKTIRVLTMLAILIAALSSAPVALAEPAACDNRANNTREKLLECVTLEAVREHQAAFQEIADANGGTRAALTPGYDASVAYVKETLEAAGYEVQLHPFDLIVVPAVLQQTAPVTATYETGAYTGSGVGTVSGTVIPVDINLVPPRESTSGCEASDFAGLDFSGPNDIALIQRGTCFFAEKAANAQAAGAEAVIILNQGNTPDREGLFIGDASTLPDGSPSNVTIPVVGASFADGVALSQPGSTAIVTVDPPEPVTQYNVIAELPGRRKGNVVMAGAHLDSVPEGPGINDNASGSAALLEVALQMAKVKPRNTVRFAWWGAEEVGLVGSTAYVAGLSQDEIDRIALYLNFDMIGSPNYVFFIYDGDDSDVEGEGPGPAGSAQIEATFERFFDSRGIPYKGTDFDGRSDYGPFIAVGIPSGGLFTGAEGIKTEEEAEIWGGTAGAQYDPCYHLACDTFANKSNFALRINADAMAFAILHYAMSTADIIRPEGTANLEVQSALPTE